MRSWIPLLFIFAILAITANAESSSESSSDSSEEVKGSGEAPANFPSLEVLMVDPASSDVLPGPGDNRKKRGLPSYYDIRKKRNLPSAYDIRK
ncbi:unnamed protein product [Caenorhabditis nigoni]